MKIRVRFAPSPTGPLHIGGVRTALYNYLFARKHGGSMILRIEDTDKNRFIPGAEEYIIKSLDWCGINFDEGVHFGGEHKPYRQSERKDIYRKYVCQLIDSGNAYYAFDTPEELDLMRQRLVDKGVANPQYDHHVRGSMKNSLTISEDEVKSRIANNDPYVVRFRIPDNKEIILEDMIRGEVHVNSLTLDDKVLLKPDQMPTYHLANVVDDHLMEISHVIRGEEWLPSLPMHKLLYDAFGWEPPQFAHLPLLLRPDGKGKLSKRDGDRLGFPIFPLEWKDTNTGEVSPGYRESGYLPDAFINFLALLGWNPGTEQEIFLMEQLIEEFSIERVSKKGARFDIEKAKWFNQQYLRKIDPDIMRLNYISLLNKKGIDTSERYSEKVLNLVKERAVFLNDLYDQSWFFFKSPKNYDGSVVKKHWKPDVSKNLKAIADIIEAGKDKSAVNLKEEVMNYIKERGLKTGQVMNSLRLSLVGKAMGPDLFEIITTLGAAETKIRILDAIKRLG